MKFATILKSILSENYVSNTDLNTLERYLDDLYDDVGIDIEFTKHFKDRVNDKRNITPITIDELYDMFKAAFKKYGHKLLNYGDDYEAVFKHMNTNINCPFRISWNRDTLEYELIAKTVMKKYDFVTGGDILKI